MRVKRNVAQLKNKFEEDEGFMKGTPQERIAFMWELTSELWSLKDPKSVKRRLQRHITNFIRQ